MGESAETIEKEVYFDQYCPKCKYYDTDEGENPCDICLGYPSNQNSHKPLEFKEA